MATAIIIAICIFQKEGIAIHIGVVEILQHLYILIAKFYTAILCNTIGDTPLITDEPAD